MEYEEGALEKFETYSDGQKKAFIDWINSAKTEQTKADRIAKTIIKVLNEDKFYQSYFIGKKDKYNKNGICTRCGDVLKQAELEFEMGPEYTYYIVTGIDHDENDKSNLAIIIPKEYKGYPVVAIKNEEK